MSNEEEKIVETIKKLNELLKSGAITREEFKILMESILDISEKKKEMTKPLPKKSFLRHVVFPIVALILILLGLTISIYPLKVPLQYLTIGVNTFTTGIRENLEVSLIEESTSILQPNTLVVISINKGALRRLPEQSLLQSSISLGEPVGIGVWRGTPEYATKVVSATTTKTVYLTDMELIYAGRTYRFVENEPLIVGNVNVVGNPIELILVDEENCARIAQNKPYQALYVMTGIEGSETISFRPPLNEEISGSYVCFIFLNRSDRQSLVTYNFGIVWRVVRQDVLTTIGPVTTTTYTTIFLTDIGLPILLIGLVILIAALFVIKTLKKRSPP